MAITVTERASREVKRLIEGRGAGVKLYLRLSVLGGGCSGLQHKLDLDTDRNEDDELFEVHGVEVVVDKRSLVFLDGSTVEFQDDLNRRGFRVDNPNAKSTCGCGSSFST